VNRDCRFAPITSLKGEFYISYAIIRNENHKVNAVPLLERHNERRNKNYSNKGIDLSRSHLNYHLKQIQADSYLKEFDRIRIRQDLKGNLRLHGEKQSTILCEFIITSDNEFFDRLGADKTRRFFEQAYDFVTAKVGGEQYVVSAVVHMDEATPHMHVSFIPVIQDKDRKGQPCKRINCSEFWKGRDSYSRLQDEYYDYMTNTCIPCHSFLLLPFLDTPFIFIIFFECLVSSFIVLHQWIVLGRSSLRNYPLQKESLFKTKEEYQN